MSRPPHRRDPTDTEVADFSVTVQSASGEAPAPDAEKRSTAVTVDGQRVRVTLTGEGLGRPLLLVNGLGATGDLFDDLRLHLADREVIAFDAPGVGGSPAPLYPHRLRWYARVAAGVISELGHPRADVLGLSWGGALVQEMAHRHPWAVRRMVLCATTPGIISLPGRPRALAILMTPARYYSTEHLRKVAPTLYGGDIAQHPDLLLRHGQVRATRPPTPIGYAYQLSALRRWTSLPNLPRMTMPTLVMAGDDDPIIPVANMRMISRLLPNARLEVLAGAGHLFLFTRTVDVVARIRAFLDAPTASVMGRSAEEGVGTVPP
jgi:poly(3-hydroxyoctanoate) depolymerase